MQLRHSKCIQECLSNSKLQKVYVTIGTSSIFFVSFSQSIPLPCAPRDQPRPVVRTHPFATTPFRRNTLTDVVHKLAENQNAKLSTYRYVGVIQSTQYLSDLNLTWTSPSAYNFGELPFLATRAQVCTRSPARRRRSSRHIIYFDTNCTIEDHYLKFEPLTFQLKITFWAFRKFWLSLSFFGAICTH